MKRVLGMTGVLVLVLATSTGAGADDLKRLIDRADTVLRGDSSAAVMAMTIKTDSYHRRYQMVLWYDGKNKKKEKTLVKILGPAMWRGHGTLKVGNQLKLYNPRTNHVTVVSHSMLGDNWMGSHFTNDDLVKETRLAEHYNHKLVKKWNGTNENGEKVTFYRVKLTPKPTAPVAWGKIIYEVWERGNVVLPARALYYRKASQKKQDRSLAFSSVQKLGGRDLPATMTITVARKPGEHTAITYKKLKFDIKIPDRKFTEQSLRH